jgi:hypothetical protein
MAKKTQGTDLYAIDPADGSVIVVGCPTTIDGIDTSVEQIETTCLNSPARTYEAGLATPGTATFGINIDPEDDSHVRLHQLKIAGETLQWAVGWSEDPGVPPTVTTDSDGDYVFVTPTSRSWILFDGFMNSFPFSFALNAVVTSTVGIQVSGEPELIPVSS